MSSRSAGYWIVLFLCLSCIVNAQSSVFDVTSYANGGKPNSDITQALANAWRDACGSHSPSKVVIPRGTYKLRGALLQGPCNAPIEVHLQGGLQAPVDGYQLLQQDFWVAFRYINKLTVFGGGTFDGQSNCHKHQNCRSTRTINLRFDYVTNSIIRDITSLDSKFFHINAFQCRNVTFQYITIIAPEDSANTDGIHIGRSYGVNVAHTNIGTGDDCISLGDGSKRIIVTNVTCGPGHGISIGSLGKYPNEEPVVGVLVKNCTLTNTQNGLRIKTFPGSPVPGSASHIHFRDITMVNVHNPILIDQEYCLDSNCGQRGPSKVKISTVSFNNIKGTSASPMLIKLLCSRKQPCENIGLTDVELKYIGDKGPSRSMCAYVKPTLTRVANALSCGTDSMGSRSGKHHHNIQNRRLL